MSEDKHNIQRYYQNLFPFETITRWLTCNYTTPFIQRQLSFEYDQGIVQRYITAPNSEQFKKKVAFVSQDKVPRKMDIGAIFNTQPQKNNKDIKAQERQLIFDFDMNDYDDVRNCCQGKKICSKCWKLLKIARQIITTTLREDFGFEKFMQVFSGGRGIHIWVCDRKARKLKDSARKAIVDYLELVTGNAKGSSLLAESVISSKPHELNKYNTDDLRDRPYIKNQLIKQWHPHVQRSLQIIKKWFMEIFTEQRALQEQKGQQIIAKILNARCPILKQRVFNRWSKCQKNTQKLYAQLIDEVQIFQTMKTNQQYVKQRQKPLPRKFQRITFIEEQIQLSFLYPRMDYNVSTKRNHLLKMPFSIHPTSKKVSVPMFKDELNDRFNDFVPEQCITINSLMSQLNQLEHDATFSFKGKSNEQIAKSTRLNEYIKAMDDFCKTL